MIEPVAPAKAMQLPAPPLEDRPHRLQRGKRLDAVAGVIAPARMRPARIARLAARAERHDLGAPLRPARALQRDIERKQDVVKGHGLSPVSRTRCSVLHAAAQSRDPSFVRRYVLHGPRLCSAPLREELRAALRPGHGVHKLRCPLATARAIWPVM